mgnify:CR=1 FL=1
MTRKPYRCERYLNWVRSWPCHWCGAPADDAHHVVGILGQAGMGTKPDDVYAVALCRYHHNLIHNLPQMWPAQWHWLKTTLDNASKHFTDGEIRDRVNEALADIQHQEENGNEQ